MVNRQSWLQNTTELSGAGTLDGNEVVRVIDDPSGTPTSKKTTVDGLSTRVVTNLIALGITLEWMGDWLTATGYDTQEAVANNGSSYICTVAHTSGASTEPGVGADWATVWDLIASKGDIGDVTPAAEAAQQAAEDAQAAAELARDEAELAVASNFYPNDTYPSTAAALGNGIQGSTGLVGGSSGTNGTFPLVATGGTEVLPVRGYFVVSGNTVTSIVVLHPGYYTSNPTGFDFSGSASLTGASATPVMGVNEGVGEFFTVPVSDSDDSAIVYRVDSGPTATRVSSTPSTDLVLPVPELTAGLGRTYTIASFIEGSGSITPSISRSVSWTSGTQYEIYCLAKAIPGSATRYLNILANSGVVASAVFDLHRGTVQVDSNILSGIGSGDTATITHLGRGLYLCYVKRTATSTASSNCQFRLYGATAAVPYTGDSASGIYIDKLVARAVNTTTNLLTVSDPEDAAFTKTSCTATQVSLSDDPAGNAISALEERVFGTTEYHKLIEGSGTITPSLFRSISIASGTEYKFIFEAKAGERTYIEFLTTAGAIGNHIFDLATGRIVSGAGGTATIEDLGDGNYRCTVVITATASTSTNAQLRIRSASNTIPYTGDGVSGLYVRKFEILASDLGITSGVSDFASALWTKTSITISENAATFRGIPFTASSNQWLDSDAVFIGDSIMQEGNVVAPLTADFGLTALNMGISGQSVSSSSSLGAERISITSLIVPSDVNLVIGYFGINDFRGNATLGSLGDTTNATFYGALYGIARRLTESNMRRRVLFVSCHNLSNDTLGGFDWETPNSNGNTLAQFQNAVRDVAELFGIAYVDMRQSGIGVGNFSEYLYDLLHPNAMGGRLLAEKIKPVIQSLYLPTLTQVATPVLQFNAASDEVTITSATSGASIYYTTDGSLPTTSSTVYSGVISLSTGETVIRAIATKSGSSRSNVARGTYTVDESGPGSGTWTLGSATIDDISVSGATLNGLYDGAGAGVNATVASGYTYGALWLADEADGNNAVEFEIAVSGAGSWVTVGDGASGWYGLGALSAATLGTAGRFSAAAGTVTTQALSPTYSHTATATGHTYRLARIGDTVQLYERLTASGAWVTVISGLDLTTLTSSGYITNTKLGLLFQNGWATARNIRVGTLT